jgi:hypothetical protein
MSSYKEIIISSIRIKCETIDHIYKSFSDSKISMCRREDNATRINSIIGDIYNILEEIRDEFVYLEAANLIEKTLTKMNRLREAGMLYDYSDDRFVY